MTVIDQTIAGFKVATKVSNGVQDVRTIGDYLPAIVGTVLGLTAGAVTFALMVSPVTY